MEQGHGNIGLKLRGGREAGSKTECRSNASMEQNKRTKTCLRQWWKVNSLIFDLQGTFQTTMLGLYGIYKKLTVSESHRSFVKEKAPEPLFRPFGTRQHQPTGTGI